MQGTASPLDSPCLLTARAPPRTGGTCAAWLRPTAAAAAAPPSSLAASCALAPHPLHCWVQHLREDWARQALRGLQGPQEEDHSVLCSQERGQEPEGAGAARGGGARLLPGGCMRPRPGGAGQAVSTRRRGPGRLYTRRRGPGRLYKEARARLCSSAPAPAHPRGGQLLRAAAFFQRLPDPPQAPASHGWRGRGHGVRQGAREGWGSAARLPRAAGCVPARTPARPHMRAQVRTMHALDHRNILKFYAW